ncbi:MAG: hypothetical protein CVV44_01815 [Spirochaetae bacterium HGW-Spirochaetae-1]|jgi:iron complex transport system substrate-binding protein|nr:MAG: hypothetical protein CVV44_01815 [Spirochaetae bacterium HGW-Spirochaetae-1]
MTRRERITILTLSLLVVVVAGFVLFIFHGFTDVEKKNGGRYVTDRVGNKMLIPERPVRIACLAGPSYEKIFMLGGADRVALIPIEMPSWSYVLNPELKNIPISPYGHGGADVERMLQLKVDLVIHWPWAVSRESLERAGLTGVCPYTDKRRPETMEAFINNYLDEIRFYGEILGGDAPDRAGEYCRYYREIVSLVRRRIDSVPRGERPRVYYAMHSDLLSTQGKNSTTAWSVTMAGGEMVSRELTEYFAGVSVEQVIAWNPAFIFVGYQGDTDSPLFKSAWKSVKAVKEKNVYRIPRGAFFWDMASTEGGLFLLFMAKTMYPRQFSDVDMVEYTCNFYKRFYRYPLTDGQARRILKGQPPLL